MLKPNRELKVWQFYTEDKEGRTCLVDEKECKAPARTKVWKELQVLLDAKDHIRSVGYSIKE